MYLVYTTARLQASICWQIRRIDFLEANM